MLSTSIFSFSDNVLKGFFLRIIRSSDCVLESYKPQKPFTTLMISFVFNIVSKRFWENETNACYQHFLLFPRLETELSTLESLVGGLMYFINFFTITILNIYVIVSRKLFKYRSICRRVINTRHGI